MASLPPEKSPKPGINIYGFAAVNPYKLTIACEELGVRYNYIPIDLAAGENLSAWYTAINPNGRMPALVHLKPDNTTTTIWESGACLLYLVSEFDPTNTKLSHPPGTQAYWSQLSWLSWQISGYGPMLGQATHFNRYATEKVPYGIWRYTAESRRLNAVLDKQLAMTGKYITPGDKVTIADVAVFIFAYSAAWCGVELDEFPNVKGWVGRLLERKGFQDGLNKGPMGPYMFCDPKTRDGEENPGFHREMRRMGSKGIWAWTQMWDGVDKIPVLPSDHANLGDEW